jgi:hypothetical protein
VLAGITEWPVFYPWDHVIACDDTADVSDTTLYVMRVDKPDGILFESGVVLRYGATAKYARTCGMRVSIIGKCEPLYVYHADGAEPLRELYASSIADRDRKDMVNVLTGRLQRSKRERIKNYLHSSEREARGLQRAGDRLILFTQSHCLLQRIASCKLVDGYRPLGLLLLDRARVELHKLCRAVSGVASVVAVNTDCVYFTGDCDAVRQVWPVAAGKLFSDFGKISIERVQWRCVPKWHLKEVGTGVPKFHELVAAPHRFIADEWNPTEEELAGGNLSVDGPGLAGLGKTTLLINHVNRMILRDEEAEGVRPRALLVASSNQLLEDKGGGLIETATVDRLVGLCVDDGKRTQDAKNNRMQASHYRYIIVDENASIPPYKWVRLRRLIRQGGATTWFTAGDPYQNVPIGLEAMQKPFGRYYLDRLLPDMFPNRVRLRILKRMASAEDSDKMRAMIADLVALVDEPVADMSSALFDTLVRHGIKFTHVVDTGVPHQAYLNRTVDFLNAAIHAKLHGADADPYAVGNTVVCREFLKAAKCHSNVCYRIAHVSTVNRKGAAVDGFTLERRGGARVKVSEVELRSHFRPAYARTGHSWQGSTCGSRTQIHDLLHPRVSPNWVLTAVTRCTTFGGVEIVVPKSKLPK